MFGGAELLALLVLAFAGAMVVGYVSALARPRVGDNGEVLRAPLGRSAVMIAIGMVGVVWSLASLLS